MKDVENTIKLIVETINSLWILLIFFKNY
jgi:hypothetical protein